MMSDSAIVGNRLIRRAPALRDGRRELDHPETISDTLIAALAHPGETVLHDARHRHCSH